MAKMVKLDDDVYERLSSLGEFKESYSDVVKKLVDYYQEEKGVKKKQ